jgi:DNA polymerase-3 subunit alpha
VNGCIERGIDKKLADEIFQQMETFARYGFNRSHTAAYALVSAQTAYLKAHYGVEFMAALMTHDMRIAIRPSRTLMSVDEAESRYWLRT